MDRRSFDLNYENNILFYDEALTAEMRARQDAYLASSNEVRLADVVVWSAVRRLWNNTARMLSPLL
jgi:cardiolipin synthase